MANKTNVQDAAANEKKVVTNWSALKSAQVVPTSLECNSYRPFHRVDLSCHTRLVPRAESVVRHLEMGHGGGFQIKLRRADKPWPEWERLGELGLEASDFRCEICDKQVPFHPIHILNHLKSHSGKIKRVSPGGVFNLTVTSQAVAPPIEDEVFSEYPE